MKRLNKIGKWLILRFYGDYTFPIENQPTYEKNGEVRTIEEFTVEDNGSIQVLYKEGKSKRGSWIELTPDDTKIVNAIYKALDKDEVKAVREENSIDVLQEYWGKQKTALECVKIVSVDSYSLSLVKTP